MLHPTRSPTSFDLLLASVEDVGRDVLAVHAVDVDRAARFPVESIDALKRLRLLGCYAPTDMGGLGLDVAQVARICEALGSHCASTALIFAMHQSQMACLVHHALRSEALAAQLRAIVDAQWLLASATTEMGTGGDVRSSICALQIDGDRFRLTKQAPVISYGRHADGILVTCRRAEAAAAGDQVHVLVLRDQIRLRPVSGWDTLGFRGTCSEGFVLEADGALTQVLPAPYAEIHRRTMQPFSHVVWASVWLGMATAALQRARRAVRAEARRSIGTTPLSAVRLAEADGALFTLRAAVRQTLADYRQALDAGPDEAAQGAGFAFAIELNNLKLTASQLLIDIVGRAMLICGMAGYRNDSELTLGRSLRDAYGAALMVNNDRIYNQSATMLLASR